MARYPTSRRSRPSGARLLLTVALLFALLGGALADRLLAVIYFG